MRRTFTLQLQPNDAMNARAVRLSYGIDVYLRKTPEGWHWCDCYDDVAIIGPITHPRDPFHHLATARERVRERARLRTAVKRIRSDLNQIMK